MKARIAELEAQQKALTDAAAAKAAAAATATAPVTAQAAAAPAPPDISAETTTKSGPFPGDWTWLNSNGRVVDTPMATKYFTPEFRADVNYIFDFNHPKDDTMGGSTESFRSQEFQLEQLSFGGDFRLQNVRARFLTMFGEFATTTPRNDASFSRGQWDLANAYRYVSEAWGGYHWDKMHGINVDAGIKIDTANCVHFFSPIPRVSSCCSALPNSF